ncbi:Ig-like domain-containing protein [Pseudomonas parafulva]|uniref:Ig-like domain-containing protein n=1 Tax=Pseudomonas parafulva TaxID=157782 RepID=UPI003D6D3A54
MLVGPGGTVIGGRGEPGATVEVRDASGTLLGSAVVTANGTFLVNLDPAVQPGEQLSLVQTDPSGNASPAVDYEVPLERDPAGQRRGHCQRHLPGQPRPRRATRRATEPGADRP